jgi:chaperone modulatory protein CbpM
MAGEHADMVLLLDETGTIGLPGLAELSGLELAALEELAQAGLLGEGAAGSAACSLVGLRIARRAGRLRSAFDLSDSGLVLALTLLQRIDALERRLRELECELPRLG